MQLVIDISENMLKAIEINGKGTIGVLTGELFRILMRGTPLPKGHGRLIDADVLEKDIEDYSEGAFAMTPEFLVKDASTIIEADKEEREV